MNSITDLLLFNLLLEQVSLKFRETYSPQQSIMKDWKGQDIINFQDDLRSKTGSSVSEKWFYTYIKNEPEKLPRIDILNMLSVYVGCDHWSAFAKANEDYLMPDYSTALKKDTSSSIENVLKILLKVIITIAGMAITYIVLSNKEYDYNFCLKDFYRKEAIKNVPFTIYRINTNQKERIEVNEDGCFSGRSDSKNNTFIIESPYYKNDTLSLNLERLVSRDIYLKPDDYALMLDYYSNGDIKSLKNRRRQLDQLLHKDVIIMELLPYEIGVTIYDKQQFIDKLTTPTQSLKKLLIVDTEYAGEQIKKIKYRIKS